MQDEEYDPLIERLLKEAEWMDDAPPGAEFTHSFLATSLPDVVAALGVILPRDPRPFPEVFTQPSLALAERRVFAVDVAGGVILWHKQEHLPIAIALSKHCECVAHWISVNEEMTLWAYARFRNGECQELILDPVLYWRENMLHGEDLVGKGERLYPTLADFLSQIAPRYQPVDTIWKYHRWHDRACCDEILAAGKSDISHCVELSYASGTKDFKLIGECEMATASGLKALFHK